MEIYKDDEPIEIPDENLFLGDCKGIAIMPYEYEHMGKKHSEPQFYILTEDDGWWYMHEPEGSTFWITDLIEVLTRALPRAKELKDGSL
jgi:hypothetical protein